MIQQDSNWQQTANALLELVRQLADELHSGLVSRWRSCCPPAVTTCFAFYGVVLAGGVPVPIYPPVRLALLQDHLRR